MTDELRTPEPETHPDGWENNFSAREDLAERLRAHLVADPRSLAEVGVQVESLGYTRPYSKGFYVALPDGSRLAVMVMAIRPDIGDPRYDR